jgi:DNA-binding transcriptional ArsR family regulator
MLIMDQNLASVFAALGDPTRLAIIQRLSEGEASVQDLAEPFDISAPAISRHLKVLEQAGLISRGRDAQFRPCRLERGRLEEIGHWTKRMRRFWDQSFDRMDDYLAEIMEEKNR